MLIGHTDEVFGSPAYAGIDLVQYGELVVQDWFPRIRGDRPVMHTEHYADPGVPPHTRG